MVSSLVFSRACQTSCSLLFAKGCVPFLFQVGFSRKESFLPFLPFDPPLLEVWFPLPSHFLSFPNHLSLMKTVIPAFSVSAFFLPSPPLRGLQIEGTLPFLPVKTTFPPFSPLGPPSEPSPRVCLFLPKTLWETIFFF